VLLLDNNALLDAILGGPNHNINNFLIIKNNNNIQLHKLTHLNLV
jgi:hypothetical protein